MSRREYDSTVARIAGNLLAGVLRIDSYYSMGELGVNDQQRLFIRGAVNAARVIVAETKATEPQQAE